MSNQTWGSPCRNQLATVQGDIMLEALFRAGDALLNVPVDAVERLLQHGPHAALTGLITSVVSTLG